MPCPWASQYVCSQTRLTAPVWHVSLAGYLAATSGARMKVRLHLPGCTCDKVAALKAGQPFVPRVNKERITPRRRGKKQASVAGAGVGGDPTTSKRHACDDAGVPKMAPGPRRFPLLILLICSCYYDCEAGVPWSSLGHTPSPNWAPSVSSVFSCGFHRSCLCPASQGP